MTYILKMAKDGADYPYRTIGWHLKFAREQLKKTLAEVSGAVEIDEDTLNLIELGVERPSEDLLILLISHLQLNEKEADSLWTLAGYEFDVAEKPNVQPTFDSRIVYTDMVHVAVNDYGVVINFLQGNAANNQLNGVARVGMSKEQARRVVEVLNTALSESEKLKIKNKYLPRPKKQTGN